MKSIFNIATFLLLFNYTLIQAQTPSDSVTIKKHYYSYGGEQIFSFVQNENYNEKTSLRFSMWYHAQYHFHYDFSSFMGVFTGIGSRNIGYTSNPTNNNLYVENLTESQSGQYVMISDANDTKEMTTIKRRAYTIGFPLAFKFGNLQKGAYLFMGGEIEFPFHFKTKVWLDNRKEFKNSEWFSKQTSLYLLSAFGGIQFPWGANVKFKYYFTDFMNPEYKLESGEKPYESYKSHIMYVSFGFNLYSAKRAVKKLQSIDSMENQPEYKL